MTEKVFPDKILSEQATKRKSPKDEKCEKSNRKIEEANLVLSKIILSTLQFQRKNTSKAEKKRALLILFSKMKLIKFGKNSKKLPIFRDSNFLETLNCEHFFTNKSDLIKLVKSAETAYFDNIRKMGTFKQCLQNCNSDIGASEKNMFLKISDNLMDSVVKQRNEIAQFLEKIVQILRFLSFFENCEKMTKNVKNCDKIKIFTNLENFTLLTNKIEKTKLVLIFYKTIFKNIVKNSQNSNLAKIVKIADSFEKATDQIDQILNFSVVVTTEISKFEVRHKYFPVDFLVFDIESAQKMKKCLLDFCFELNKIKNVEVLTEESAIARVISELVATIGALKMEKIVDFEQITGKNAIREKIDSLREKIELEKKRIEENRDNFRNESIYSSKNFVENFGQLDFIDDINSFAKFLRKNKICIFGNNNEKSFFVKFILALRNFKDFAIDLTFEATKFHITTNNLANTILSLFSKLSIDGFGEKDDKTDETETGKTEKLEGTGLAKGIGDNDVTDQLDNEEQILGLKNDIENDVEENEAEEKNDIEQNDIEEGATIEGDFDETSENERIEMSENERKEISENEFEDDLTNEIANEQNIKDDAKKIEDSEDLKEDSDFIDFEQFEQNDQFDQNQQNEQNDQFEKNDNNINEKDNLSNEEIEEINEKTTDNN
ncbi:AAA ATPase midasin, variant 2, partial [Bonamia ostreae]